eukprot:259128_1
MIVLLKCIHCQLIVLKLNEINSDEIAPVKIELRTDIPITPVAWRSSLFCRPKKTGDVRMVFDYRLLNSFTINDQFPLPDIHKLLHKFKGKQLFSLLDMRAGAFEFDGNLY